MLENYDEILTPQQLIDLLGINKNIVYMLLNSGEIQSFKIGKQHRITRQSLVDYIMKKQKGK